MKRITIELPESTMCAFLNYVFYDFEGHGMVMGSLSIDSSDLEKGHVVARSKKEDHK